MNPSLLTYLACPIDRHSPMELRESQPSTDGDIREGELVCPVCKASFAIRESIPMLIPDQPSGRDDVGRLKAEERRARDADSADYDRRSPAAVVAAKVRGLQRFLNPSPSDLVLDLGCGTGRLTLELVDERCVTVGADFSFASLRIFRDRIPPYRRPLVHLVQADAFHLPFRDGVFDWSVSNELFEHLPGMLETRQPVLEVARVLSQGGRLVVATYNYSAVRALLARVFPATTFGAGYEREGRHAGAIYFRRLSAREFRHVLDAAFVVEQVMGSRVVPKAVLRRGGRAALALELALQGSRLATTLGYYLVAAARKKGSLHEVPKQR